MPDFISISSHPMIHLIMALLMLVPTVATGVLLCQDYPKKGSIRVILPLTISLGIILGVVGLSIPVIFTSQSMITWLSVPAAAVIILVVTRGVDIVRPVAPASMMAAIGTATGLSIVYLGAAIITCYLTANSQLIM